MAWSRGADAPVADSDSPASPAPGPAFYARSGGRMAQWWTLLHPPYTLWHLSYVVLGAAAVPEPDPAVLAATVLAFLLAMGVGAHALDELHGRPLGTTLPDPALWTVAVVSVSAAVGIGVGLALSAPLLWPLVALGPVLVLGYNLELVGGRMHTDTVFALAWGGFPVLAGYVAQAPGWSAAGVLAVGAAAGAGVALSTAQRRLSTSARDLRRRTAAVEGRLVRPDGSAVPLDRSRLLDPLEGGLRALCWAVPLVALAALLARLAY